MRRLLCGLPLAFLLGACSGTERPDLVQEAATPAMVSYCSRDSHVDLGMVAFEAEGYCQIHKRHAQLVSKDRCYNSRLWTQSIFNCVP